ncbi:RloB family protein [Ruegeria sp. ANG10]|uniref:RloB family protein n=1 Tax=Ruegeria sp. ANG10 TaxID=3042467 RepID=UPI003454592A
MPRRPRNSHRREPAKRIAPPTIHLFSEGKNTEPDYLRAVLAKHAKGTKILRIHGPNGVAHSVASAAVSFAQENGLIKARRRRKLNSYEERDQVWAVFDRDDDEVSRYAEAKKVCEDAGLNYAYSDPCFEHWINLHFEMCDAPCDRHQAQKRTKELIADYDPKSGKTADFSDIVEACDEAEERAKTQQNRREEEGDQEGNPSTTVFKLTEILRAR